MAKRQNGPAGAADVDAVSRPVAEPATPAISAQSGAAMNPSFVAALDQFNALARFGVSAGDMVSENGRAHLSAEKSKALKDAFIHHGMVEIDAHGGFADYLKYARAADAIRAKAAALGYGVAAQAVPILPAPGGYVGRFGGHDIYAAA